MPSNFFLFSQYFDVDMTTLHLHLHFVTLSKFGPISIWIDHVLHMTHGFSFNGPKYISHHGPVIAELFAL